jgi:hypothetical protein
MILRPGPVASMVAKVALEQVFLQILRFFPITDATSAPSPYFIHLLATLCNFCN